MVPRLVPIVVKPATAAIEDDACNEGVFDRRSSRVVRNGPDEDGNAVTYNSPRL
jgi:hypothetical protein